MSRPKLAAGNGCNRESRGMRHAPKSPYSHSVCRFLVDNRHPMELAALWRMSRMSNRFRCALSNASLLAFDFSPTFCPALFHAAKTFHAQVYTVITVGQVRIAPSEGNGTGPPSARSVICQVLGCLLASMYTAPVASTPVGRKNVHMCSAERHGQAKRPNGVSPVSNLVSPLAGSYLAASAAARRYLGTCAAGMGHQGGARQAAVSAEIHSEIHSDQQADAVYRFGRTASWEPPCAPCSPLRIPNRHLKDTKQSCFPSTASVSDSDRSILQWEILLRHDCG